MAENQVIDRLLVAKAQGGDERAFEFLVKRWSPKILGFCYRLIRDREAARDAAQETWIAAVKGLRKLDDPALFKPWIYRIAKNKAVDIIRGMQRDRKSKDAAKEMNQMKPKTTQMEEGMTLEDLVAAMPVEKRSLLALFYVEGLTIQELAEVFGIPKGTVKSRLHHSREELKASYERKPS